MLLSQKALTRRFVIEWAIATTGTGLIIPLVPRLWPFVLAIAQWLVLRRYVRKIWTWLPATVLGTYAAYLSTSMLLYGYAIIRLDGSFSPRFALYLGLCLAIAFIRSAAQYIALRKYGHRSQRWLLTGTISTTLAVGTVCLFAIAIISIYSAELSTADAIEVQVPIAVCGFIGLCCGLVKGRSLLYILKPEQVLELRGSDR